MLLLNYQTLRISIISGTFNFGTNVDLIGGQYMIKIIFDIKIEITIFEISIVPNFRKFWALLILGPIWV